MNYVALTEKQIKTKMTADILFEVVGEFSNEVLLIDVLNAALRHFGEMMKTALTILKKDENEIGRRTNGQTSRMNPIVQELSTSLPAM